MIRISIWLIICILLGIEPATSQIKQHPEKGIYYHQQYLPSEFNGHNQSWSVLENKDGLIYVGNGNGLMEYDGVQWRMIQVAGGQVALSLALSEDNRVYVGSVNDFGVIETDSLGLAFYRSISDSLPDNMKDFEDVWETKAHSGGVLFRTRSAAFYVTPDDSIEIFQPVGQFERVHKVGDTLYMIDKGTGLMKFGENEFRLVPGGEQFTDLSIWYMGGRPDGSIFIATREGTFLLDGDAIEPFETEVSSFLGNQLVYEGTEVGGTGYVFATIAGGVVMTNYDGEILDAFSSDVLTSPQATNVFIDRFENLWVTTTNGVNRVEISSPLTYFDNTTGLISAVLDVVRHDGTLFVSSSSEIRYLNENDSAINAPQFESIPVTSSSYDVFESTDRGLLVTSGFGMEEVTLSGTSPIGPELEAQDIFIPEFDPDHLLLGHRGGLALYRYENGEWNFLRNLEGITEQIYRVVQDSDSVIWAGTDFQGLIRISPAQSEDEGEEREITRFDSEEFFDARATKVGIFDDNVWIITNSGLFRPSDPWNPEQPFIPDINDLKEETDNSVQGVFNVTEGFDGRFWVLTDPGLGYVPELSNPLDSLRRGALGRIPSSNFDSVHPEEDGIVWIGSENGLVRYDSNSDYPAGISFDAFVRGVTHENDLLFGGAVNSGFDELSIPYQQNDLRFRFGTNFFEDEENTLYQVRITGFNEDWTSWSDETFRDFTNIPHGSYTLEVRALNTYGNISTPGTFSFEILPPWWFSWWAYISYFLIFAGLVFAADRFQRKRLIKKERERSREKELAQAREIEKAYEDLKAAQDQLIQQEKLASLGQLTAGIAHEIKNPLNFVNNFSEVSIEMVEEARDEVRRGTGDGRPGDSKREKNNSPLTKGDKGGCSSPQKQEVSNDDYDSGLILEILDDIEANLKKIHEHGSRADSIVKSMLQHSRGGSGKMESTDLNALIKEYVNLAFHGMRAGKDPINVDIDLQLDESVGEVPLVAEDFSRVILNVCNNAFDAMREKLSAQSNSVSRASEQAKARTEQSRSVKSEMGEDFSPTLYARTKLTNESVIIEIEDNGPGIPDEMKDKILQPFYTTKKGTQGTGLGLSITNDIVKAHGGELAIESREGEFTRFSIQLNRK
ncbi:ATP-binding protein [Rhodohalobacter mucosus]|nr:ATP-binding protein [Rhodohalobacter mucosus]